MEGLLMSLETNENTNTTVFLHGKAVVPSDKSKKTMLILTAALGWLGAHKFYTGKVGAGFLYMFTAGLFVVGWGYDIIKVASGTYLDNFGRPIMR
jgi:restriction system protein